MFADPLTSTFSALADPTRRAILSRLTSGEATVTELAEPFQMTMPAITKHLKVLERAGLISRGRDAQRRPCRLETEPLQNISQWIQQYQKFWDESFDRLDEYLQEKLNQEKLSSAASKKNSASQVNLKNAKVKRNKSAANKKTGVKHGHRRKKTS
jgi:DNA-binding transcriptional ArsR family regulator